ncbi:CsgG/HfaB family protein [Alphaproteobacteria bacterium]|nr:CsgG/HfaB family protein [Alphaproteobacteria bacterium]
MKLFYLITLVLISFNFNANAKLNTVEVNTEGTGATKQLAILDGMKNAITQVNGAVVGAKTSMSISETSKSQDQNSSYESSERFKQDIKTATKGVVQGFDIVSVSQNPDLGNLYEISMVVKVAKFKKSKQLKRLRMAVSNFYLSNDLSKSKTANKFTVNLQDKIIDLLTQTRKFAMLDRQFLKDQQKELNFINSPDVPTEEMAKFGNNAGTDYIITGVLKDLKKKITTKKMQTTGKVFKNTKYSAELNYRIIDVATTQVKFSDTTNITISSGSIKKLRNLVANKTAETILNSIYPIRVIDINNNSLTLGQGGKSIKKNAEYNLVKIGERMIDPYTKESLGRKEQIIGKVKITDVQSKMSTAKLIKSKVKNIEELLKYDYIVRPIKSVNYGSVAASKSYKKLKKTIEKDFEKLKEKRKNDW